MIQTNAAATAVNARAADDGWVRTRDVSPHAPLEALETVPPFVDTTLRQVVRISGGERQVRIRFTNEYGTAPLTIGAAHVGLAAPGGGVQPDSDRELTFSGRSTAAVPAGAPMPWEGGDIFSAEGESARQAVNAWI